MPAVFLGILFSRREADEKTRGKAGRKTADPLGGSRPQAPGDPLRTHGKPQTKLNVKFRFVGQSVSLSSQPCHSEQAKRVEESVSSSVDFIKGERILRLRFTPLRKTLLVQEIYRTPRQTGIYRILTDFTIIQRNWQIVNCMFSGKTGNNEP